MVIWLGLRARDYWRCCRFRQYLEIPLRYRGKRGWRFCIGLRIDHILLSAGLATHCQACHIDKEPRAWERPSDHAVVYALINI